VSALRELASDPARRRAMAEAVERLWRTLFQRSHAIERWVSLLRDVQRSGASQFAARGSAASRLLHSCGIFDPSGDL
jgi:hypothetical protein